MKSLLASMMTSETKKKWTHICINFIDKSTLITKNQLVYLSPLGIKLPMLFLSILIGLPGRTIIPMLLLVTFLLGCCAFWSQQLHSPFFFFTKLPNIDVIHPLHHYQLHPTCLRVELHLMARCFLKNRRLSQFAYQMNLIFIQKIKQLRKRKRKLSKVFWLIWSY